MGTKKIFHSILVASVAGFFTFTAFQKIMENWL